MREPDDRERQRARETAHEPSADLVVSAQQHHHGEEDSSQKNSGVASTRTNAAGRDAARTVVVWRTRAQQRPCDHRCERDHRRLAQRVEAAEVHEDDVHDVPPERTT